MNRPQPIMPEITTPMVLRQILATPIYIIALIFNLLSELFTSIAERIDGVSWRYFERPIGIGNDLAARTTRHRRCPIVAGSDQTEGEGFSAIT